MSHRAGKHLAFAIFITLALVALNDLKVVAASSQEAQQETCPMSEVESSIVAQLKTGGIADLGNLPDDKRVIRACFLKRLLTSSIEGLKLESSGVRIKNAVIDGKLELYNEKIPFSVSLISCEFRDVVKFFNVSIAGDLNISYKFITLDACDENTGFKPQGSIFNNRAIFRNVTISGDLRANGSQFKWRHPDSCADECDEPNSACDAADFEEVKVTNDAFFNNAVFDGFADFEGAHFSQVFFAEEATFKDQADFVDIRVTDDASFKGATFTSAADFKRAKIENKFEIAGVHFLDSNVDFQDMQVGQLVLNGDTNFCKTNLWADIGGMTYQRIAYQPPESRNTGKDEPKNVGQVKIGNDEQAWDRWLDVVDNSVYRVDAYAALEDFIKNQGRMNRANNVYIHFRDREAREVRRERPFIGIVLWCWDFFAKWTVGYGRWPWLALIYSLIIIVVGCWLFPSDKMIPRDETKASSYYNRLWYSTDLYLPVVDLQANEAWMPDKEKHPILWHYMHIHALLGWVLVPIGLAALTGIIK